MKLERGMSDEQHFACPGQDSVRRVLGVTAAVDERGVGIALGQLLPRAQILATEEPGPVGRRAAVRARRVHPASAAIAGAYHFLVSFGKDLRS